VEEEFPLSDDIRNGRDHARSLRLIYEPCSGADCRRESVVNNLIDNMRFKVSIVSNAYDPIDIDNPTKAILEGELLSRFGSNTKSVIF
jgi:hypothetical protein